ncbi:Trimeric GatFAB AmidoTransferase(AdT) complex subunit [Knufia peltigerae]|uniref:Glutamyl-tRNA(Gln) amidotransferase subunit A, mitochondrial n=1 Tax=Knufia peltigerae TaxID=1002370 RepID=A0AA38Y2G1_9EURO|nr:Trimeric GatFAB AmidoTransferase(AdT) complex subunit [Knufia peltigerae]
MPHRIGRGYRHHQDIQLLRNVYSVLGQSLNPRDYGNPFISLSQVLRDPESLLLDTAKAHGAHKLTKDFKNYYGIKSANHGYTVVIKDNIVTPELPTTCASNTLKGFLPPQTSTVADLLRRGGQIMLAKTNMDEFGMGSHSINSAYGEVHNGTVDGPQGGTALSVGGSSGGSALAVAANLANVGIGTDTGGSIRLPAAYMSLVGFKPSYGMISRKGVVPYANSLDTVGLVAKSVQDVWLTYDILKKPDDNDPTCLSSSSRSRVHYATYARDAALQGNKILPVILNGPRFGPAAPTETPGRYHPRRHPLPTSKGVPKRIGVPLEYNIQEMHPLVRWSWMATLSHLEKAGCEIVPISLPSTKHALSSYYILAPAEASSNLAKYDGVRYGNSRHDHVDDDAANGTTLYSRFRGQNFGPEVQRRILLGTFSLSAGAMDNYFIQAQKIRRMVQQDFDSVFRMPNPLRDNTKVNKQGVDFIVVPTAPTPPPRLKYVRNATPLESYINDVFTVPASLAGLPAISVPGPRHPDYPWRPEVAVGMQLIGQYGDDFNVLKMANDELTNFHKGVVRVRYGKHM